MALNEHGTQSLAALTKGRARLFRACSCSRTTPCRRPLPPRTPPAGAALWHRGGEGGASLSLVVSSRGETLQLRLEFDGEQIPEARAEAVLADWLAELDWLAQTDLSQPARVAAAPSPAKAQVAATKAEPGLAQPPAEAPRWWPYGSASAACPASGSRPCVNSGWIRCSSSPCWRLSTGVWPGRAPLTLQMLKAHPSPAGSIGTGWCAKRRPRYDSDHQA